MKSWLIALLAAVVAFFLGIGIGIEVLVFLPMPGAAPGASIGWDPISLFHSTGWTLLLFAALISLLTFVAIYRHLSLKNE
jgi:hypothetical protein